MNSLVPIYQQIKESIKSWIIDGIYKPSQKIPSESELIKEFGVSRLTIRQALGILAKEGYLVSKRGKGSYVTTDPSKLSNLRKRFYGSIDDLVYHSEKLKTKKVKIGDIRPSPIIRYRLELGRRDDFIKEITRVRVSEDIPVVVTKSYMRLKYGQFLSEAKLMERPLILGILEEEAGVTWRHVIQTIEATFADESLSGLLNITSGSPMLRVERIMMAKRLKPIVLAVSWFRADVFKYFEGFRIVHRNGRRKLLYAGFRDAAKWASFGSLDGSTYD